MAGLAYGRAILGRGCDPVRAAHASKAWAPLLKADVFCVTSDEDLEVQLKSGTKFSAFFIAPGYCSLAAARRVDGPGMLAMVERYQPGCPVVFVEQVEHGLQQLAEVLDGEGAAKLPSVKTMTADWPWVD
jgi:hypothetical protein